MKKILILAAFAAVFTQCKKEEPAPTPAPTPTVSENEKNFGATPTDAQGAVYALRTVNYNSFGASDSLETGGPYYAWFGSSSQTEDVGTLKCNNVDLFVTDPFTSAKLNWYYGFGFGTPNGSTATWNLQGTSAFGTWNYVDNSPYPLTKVTSLPTSVTLGQNIRVVFNTATSAGVLVRIDDRLGTVIERVGTSGANDMTFTGADLVPVVSDVDEVSVSIVTFNYVPQMLGGKKIYVVKENIVNTLIEVK